MIRLPRRVVLSSGLAALASPLLSRPKGALAQDAYPTRPIRMIVPWPPGGVTDVVARLIALKLSTELGQSVVVENRPGASGTIGHAAAAQAEPDGYTLLFGTNSTMRWRRICWARCPTTTRNHLPRFLSLLEARTCCARIRPCR